jgi:F-type H+-transporting ATPase subunit alpha
MRKISGRIRLDLAQYREMAAFAQFGSDLDKATQDKLSQGARLMEVLKQPQLSPYPLEEQIAILFLAVNGYLLDIKTENISSFVKDFLSHLKSRKADLMRSIAETGVVSTEQEDELRVTVESFKGVKK